MINGIIPTLGIGDWGLGIWDLGLGVLGADPAPPKPKPNNQTNKLIKKKK